LRQRVKEETGLDGKSPDADIDGEEATMSTNVSITELIEGMGKLLRGEYSREGVSDFLRDHLVALGSLEPYVRFNDRSYTRNLIHKEDLFEAVLLCWEPGQHSMVHRHRDQVGWLTVIQGQLSITTFGKLRSDVMERHEPDINWSPLNSVYLRETHRYKVSENEVFQEVNEPETIHRTENAGHQQAISLHICTHPSETAVIYDVENHRCRTVRMGYV
jgi:cysteine dioxygenase